MNNQVSPCSASLKSTWSVSGIRAAESQVSLITGREMNHLLGARFAECLWSSQDMHAHTRSHTHLLQMTELLECKLNAQKLMKCWKTNINAHLYFCLCEDFDVQIWRHSPAPYPGANHPNQILNLKLVFNLNLKRNSGLTLSWNRVLELSFEAKLFSFWKSNAHPHTPMHIHLLGWSLGKIPTLTTLPIFLFPQISDPDRFWELFIPSSWTLSAQLAEPSTKTMSNYTRAHV